MTLSVLDDMVSAGSEDSLKTRSLPAFLRSKQRPLSTEDDTYQLYAKVIYNFKVPALKSFSLVIF